MSVELSPANQLGFPRPLTQLVKRSLLIHNPNSSPIAFKVKTTAPKQYCVRPNSGRVEAGESVEVQVLLQPLASEPPPHAKCKDKFLVQSAFIAPDEEMKTLSEMWSHTEKTNKSAIQEQKVKCAYVAAEDGTHNANGIPEEAEDSTFVTSGDTSRLDESASRAFNTPKTGLSRWTTQPEKEIDSTLFRNGGMTYYEVDSPAKASVIAVVAQLFSAAESSPVHANTGPATPPVPVAAQAPPTSATLPTGPPIPSLTTEQIQKTGPSPTNVALEKSVTASAPEGDKLNAALQQIDQLQKQIAEAAGPTVTGLRKRGGAAAESVQAGAETAVEKTKEVVQGATGVPIEVVGGLLLAVFVLTYLFF